MFAYNVKSSELNIYSDAKFSVLSTKCQSRIMLTGMDSSLSATLLTTVGPRMMKFGRVFRSRARTTGITTCLTMDDRAMLGTDFNLKQLLCDLGIGVAEEGDYLYIHNVPILYSQLIEDIKEFVPGHTSKIKIHNDIMDFFAAKGIKSLVMSQENENIAVFLVENIKTKAFHGIQAFIPVVFPNYFKDENQLSEKEKELFTSLMHHRATTYIELANQIIDEMDIGDTIIEGYLRNFSKGLINNEIEARQREYDRAMMTMRDWENRYAAIIENIQRASDMLAASKARNVDEDDNDLINMFKTSKFLELNNVQEDEIRFTVNKYIDIFDPEIYETLIKNQNSYLYERTDNPTFDDRRNRKIFLDSLFSENPVYKIRIQAMYKLSIIGASVHGEAPYLRKQRLGNPHLSHYNCLGGYETLIQQELRNRNIVGAINQCVASAGSLNLADCPVMTKFLRDLIENPGLYIERISDKQLFTPIDALNELPKENSDGTEHQND